MSGGAPIFKMTADARELGQIDLNISKNDGAVESIDWKVIPVTTRRRRIRQFAASIVNMAPDEGTGAACRPQHSVELDARSAVGRKQETNVGDLIADAFRNSTGSDVGLMNGGSIRADEIIKAGPLTRRDMLVDSAVQEQGGEDGSERRNSARGAGARRGAQR